MKSGVGGVSSRRTWDSHRLIESLSTSKTEHRHYSLPERFLYEQPCPFVLIRNRHLSCPGYFGACHSPIRRGAMQCMLQCNAPCRPDRGGGHYAIRRFGPRHHIQASITGSQERVADEWLRGHSPLSGVPLEAVPGVTHVFWHRNSLRRPSPARIGPCEKHLKM